MSAVFAIIVFFGTYISLALLPRGAASGYGLAVAAVCLGLATRFDGFAPLILPASAGVLAAAIALGARYALGDWLTPKTYQALLGVPPMLVVIAALFLPSL